MDLMDDMDGEWTIWTLWTVWTWDYGALGSGGMMKESREACSFGRGEGDGVPWVPISSINPTTSNQLHR